MFCSPCYHSYHGYNVTTYSVVTNFTVFTEVICVSKLNLNQNVQTSFGSPSSFEVNDCRGCFTGDKSVGA